MSAKYHHFHNKLDLEFRRILRLIKPYIPHIMNNHYLCSYRTWLEKLSESDFLDKEERNRYLSELCHQIQNGILEEPFLKFPPSGSLPPFRCAIQDSKIQVQQESVTIPTEDDSVKQQQRNVNDYFGCKPTNYTKDFSKMRQALQNKSDTSKSEFTFRQRQNIQSRVRNRHTICKAQDNERREFNNAAQQRDIARDYAFSFMQLPNPNYSTASQLSYATQNMPSKLSAYEQSKGSVLDCSQSCNKANVNIIQGSFSIARQDSNGGQQQQTNTDDIDTKFTNDETDDNSSWCDMSEVTSTTKLGSGDSDKPRTPQYTGSSITKKRNKRLRDMYESKVSDLMNVIGDLQKQNVLLNEHITKYERDLSLRNSKAETSIHNLAGEVTALKSRLQDLAELKSVLKNSQFIVSSQWQSTVETLNKKLIDTYNQNAKLKMDINTLEKKLEEFSTQRQNEYTGLRQKLHNVHIKEIEMLKQNHVKHISDIELKFNKILKEKEIEFNQKLDDLRESYENRIYDINNECEKTVQNKNVEIQRLEIAIENQCKRMHEEVVGIRDKMQENVLISNDENAEKITYLQKCIAKMDKLFKKSERDYVKRMTKLKRELEMKDKTTQLQLSTQRAELIANTNTERQMEMDTAIMQLEERYRKLLEQQQTSFFEEKQRDAELISELKSIISKNNADVYSFYHDL